MNKDMRLWKNIQTVGLVVDDSLSVRTRSWLQIVSGDLCKVFESRKGFEFAWKIDFGFEFFLDFLQFGYGVLSSFCTWKALGFTSAYIVEWKLGQILVKNPLYSCLQYLILIKSFPTFLIDKTCQNWVILMSLICTRIASLPWSHLLHKKIWKPCFDIFLQLN